MKCFTPFIILIFLLYSCKKKSQIQEIINPVYSDQYTVVANKIYNYNNPIQLIGTNSFHIFGAGSTDMNSWHLDVAREFVGNVKEVKLLGNPFQDSNGSYLHSLQAVVDSNRLNNRITIFCPMQWNGLSATNFTGKMPTQTFWWDDYKIKLSQWAVQFNHQPDVWLEVWNEPYRYDRADGYTDNMWMNDMNELVSVIRNAGNNNIILVPCAEQGQDESVLNNKGSIFLKGKINILFDVHAYEKWLLVSNVSMGSRLQQIKQNRLPVFFGETAPLNAGTLMNPRAFLDSVYNNGLSVCAWAWKYDSNDPDALLNAMGLPNDNNNNSWGTVFKTLGLRIRKP
jgi:mannan endo-1,4-beta-mannosidase